MIAELTSFREYGTETVCSETYCAALKLAVPTFTNEFWTAKQRAAHSLHEISYRQALQLLSFPILLSCMILNP